MRRRHAARATQHGFSLMEIVVAMGLFALSMAGFASLAMSSTWANGHSRRHGAATALAQSKLEELRNVVMTALVSGADGTTLTASGTPGGIYSRSWTVQHGTPTATSATVAVTVTWSAPPGNHQLELRTVVTD